MKVLVVRQPWAWLIVNGYKDVENRSWKTHYTGPILIQAAAHRLTANEDAEFRQFVKKRGVTLPEAFDLGGIVGMAKLKKCVTASKSKWFEGPVGWVLEDPKRLKFTPMKGQLGLFDAPKNVLTRLGLKT